MRLQKRELAYTAGGKANWGSHCAKENGDSSQKLRLKRPYNNLAIPLHGLYPKNMKILICKDKCMPMLAAALLTIVETWKSTNECITKIWCMYVFMCVCIRHNHKKKKDEMWPFMTTWMDREGITLNEIKQMEKTIP